MNEETLVKEHLVPYLEKIFTEFLTLLVNEDFEALSQRFPLNCSPREFQDGVSNWSGSNKFVMPPPEAFTDLEYAGFSDSVKFASQLETMPPGEKEHCIRIHADDNNLEYFMCHMYLWDKLGRTDVSLILTIRNPLQSGDLVQWVDLRIM